MRRTSRQRGKHEGACDALYHIWTPCETSLELPDHAARFSPAPSAFPPPCSKTHLSAQACAALASLVLHVSAPTPCCARYWLCRSSETFSTEPAAAEDVLVAAGAVLDVRVRVDVTVVGLRVLDAVGLRIDTGRVVDDFLVGLFFEDVDAFFEDDAFFDEERCLAGAAVCPAGVP